MTKEVIVVLEHRFYRVGDEVYTALSFPYSYWKEYLEFFDQVKVVARVKRVSQVREGFVKASGENVSFRDVPYYQGLAMFFIMLPFLIVNVARSVRVGQFFLLRSGNVANMAFFFIAISKKRYIREYPGSIKDGIVGMMGTSPLYRGIASFSDWLARLQGRYSRANSFVSDYCCSLYGSKRPSFVFSSFNSDEIKARKRTYGATTDSTLSLISVGRLEKEKGHLSLLEAMVEMKTKSEKVSLTLVGEGSDRARLERYAQDNRIDVTFLGSVTKREYLFQTVLTNDVFVIPSITEGMPRALLEAMALGMPCVGTRVGGVPEVLEESSMCPPNESGKLADNILKLKSTDLRKQYGERNYRFIAQYFSNDSLKEKRHQFWSMLYE